MLSDMIFKRVRGLTTSLVLALMALVLLVGAQRALAAPSGVNDDPKPAESKEKNKDSEKDETAEDKPSPDKKDAKPDDEKKSDDKAGKDEDADKKGDAEKSDVEKERERVARENEAAKQKAMEKLGKDMTADEKAALEAQLEALKQEAIKSVGKPTTTAPTTAPSSATIRPQVAKPGEPARPLPDAGKDKRVRRRLTTPADKEAGSHVKLNQRSPRGTDIKGQMPDAGADKADEATGDKKDVKTGAPEKSAAELAREKAQQRRAEMEARRRERLDKRNSKETDKGAVKTGAGTTPSPKLGVKGRPTPPVTGEGAVDEGESASGARSPIGPIQTGRIKFLPGSPPPGEAFSINYVDTPWMDVVSDFARMSHLPFVRHLDDEIDGNLTYFSTENFGYDEAFHKLNELLFDQPLNNFVIQRLPDRITVVRIPDLLKDIPTEHIYGSFAEFKAANLDDYTACQTLYTVPAPFTPSFVIEEWRPLFSDTYGVKVADNDKLELTGFAREHRYFDQMVTHLMQITQPPKPESWTKITLENAKANDLVTLLRQLYPIDATAAPTPRGRRGRRGGRRQPQPNAVAPDLEDADKIQITADPKENALYITAPDYMMTELRARIAQLDVPAESRPEMELVELDNADAASVAQQVLPILQQMLAAVTKSQDFISPRDRAKYDVNLYPSTNTNGVILVGPREGIEFVKPLIRQYDVEPDWITRSIPLQHRDASYIVERLNNAMPSGGGGPTPRRQRAPVKGGPAVVPDTTPGPQIEIESSRSLFVSATRFDMKKIEELVEKLDVVDPEEPGEHFIYLRCANPTQVAQTVQQIMSEDNSAPPTVQASGANNSTKARAAARRRAIRRARGRSTQSGGDGPLFIPNDADQSLLIYCSDADWAEVQRLIDRLESNACDVEPQYVEIKLNHAEPTDVAAMVNQMFPAPNGATQIVGADSFNKTVTIFATPMFIEKVQPLIDKLDASTKTGELTVIKLQWAKAEIIAPIIQQAVPESQYLSPVAQINQAKSATQRGKTPARRNPRRVVQSAGDTAVRIVAEPVTNSLLVTAPPDKLETIQDLVDQMEAVAKNRRPEKVIVNVVNRKADEIAGVLTSILNATKSAGGGKDGGAGGSVNPTDVELSITAIGDQLILFGPQDEVAEAIQLVDQIDTQDAAPITRKVRVYDAEEDEKKLRAMLALKTTTNVAVNQAPPQRGNRRGNRRAPARAPTKLTDAGASVSDVQIYANIYENTLLIRAMPKDWKVIDEILEVIRDEAPLPPGEEEYDTFYIVHLKHKSAWDISYDLEDVINTEGRRPVTFKEGPHEKDLIVMNFRPSQREEIDKWIEIYDVPSEGYDGTSTITVKTKGGPSAAIAAINAVKANAGVGTPINVIEFDSGSLPKVIDIHADEEEPETPASTEKKKADRGAKGEPVSAVPSHMLPLWLRDVICATALGQTDTRSDKAADDNATDKKDAEPDTPAQGVQILVDPMTGEIRVIGRDEEASKVRDMLEDMMSEGSDEEVTRIFPLKYAPVSEVAQKLSEIINGPAQRVVPQRRGRPQPGQQPNQQQGNKQGDEKGGRNAQQPQPQVQRPTPMRVRVVADERTSSVIVTAPPKEIPLIIMLLRHLDSKQIDRYNLKMFELKNLDASQVVQNLKEILGLEDRPQVRTPQRPGRGGNNRNPQQVQIQGEQGDTLISADKVKLTAEVQTNTVIAQGPPDTLELIEQIINDLEEKTVKGVEMMRVVLKKARASEIADIVQSLVDETINNQGASAPAPRGGRGRRGRTPTASANNNNVSVHADPRTNSVILAGPKELLDRAREIVEELDSTEEGLVIRQIPVKGPATELANALKALYPESGSRGQGTDVIITPMDATHTILVKAPAPLMVNIAEQLTKLDAPFEETGKQREIKLQFANAETVASQLMDLYSGSTRRNNRTAEISIKGIKSNNTLYVKAPQDVFEEIEATARNLDNVTPVQVYRKQLKHAPAQAVLQKIQQMMAEAMRPGGAASSMNLDYVSMQSDPRTNSLILVGGPTSSLLLDQMLQNIDVPRGDTEQDTQVYTLPESVNVNDIVRNINELFRGVSLQNNGVEPPVVTPNADSHLVIVRATKKQHEQIDRDVIKPVSKKGDKPPRTDHIYVVENAKAPDLANTLTRLVRETMQQVDRKWPVNVVADEGTNKLVVNATDEDYEKFMPLIKQLDEESGSRTTEVFKVEYVSPWSMASIINEQFRTRGSRNPADQVNASFEDGTFSLIVTANKQNMEKVADLIKKADVPTKETITNYVQLKYGQSDQMRNSIDAALRGKFPSDRRGQMPFTITSDNISNQLIVSAREDIMPEVLDMIKNLDVPSGAEKIRRVFRLTYADPGSVSRMIQTVFRQRGQYSPRESIESSDDWTTNSVIVSATEEKMKEVEDLINQMDQAGDGARSEHVIDVVNADPNDVAQSLQQILQQASQGRRGRQAPVIRAVRGTTKIVAYATDKEFESIQSLVATIDGEGGRIVNVVTIPDGVPAQTIADNINNIFGGGRGGDGPHAEAHEPTNTLIVRASDDEFKKIQKELIEPLTNSEATGIFKIYYIPVKNAVADEVAQTMQQFFDKKAGIASNRGFGRFGRGGQSSADRDNQVTITAEPNSNTLIVYCTEKTKKDIDELLAVIDSSDTTEKRVEMVALQYVDANTMIDILTEVLRVSRSTAQEPDDRPWWARRDDGNDEKDVVLAGDTRLKAIPETNSVIVAGKSDAVEDALAKIKELDKPVEGDTPVFVQLENANAMEVADMLNEIYSEEQRGRTASQGRGRSGRSSSSTTNGPKLTIVADQTTNTLIVRGKTSDVNDVVDMAKRIDTQSVGPMGTVVIAVPSSYNAEDLADKIQNQINEAERTIGSARRNYQPDLVTITADTRSNVMLVNASKTKMNQVRDMMDQMIARAGQYGGRTRTFIKLDNLTPEEARQLIETLQQGQENAGGSNRGRRSGRRGQGRRGDANWTHNRRYDEAKPAIVPAKPKRAGTMVAATMPVFLMNVALHTGLAQTDAPKKEDAQPPRSIRIRPQRPASTQPANQPNSRRGNQPTAKDRELQSSAERLIRERAAQTRMNVSDEALDAVSKQLSGSPVTIVETPDGLIVEGLEGDVDTFQKILTMIDQSTAPKDIEFMLLKNAQAEDLAQRLTDVFKKIEPQNARPEDRVDFVADKRINGIYIAANDENMEIAKTLIAKADSDAMGAGPQTRNFVFQNRRVAEVGETMKTIIQNYLRQRGLSTDQIQIQIDPPTNQVIVTGGKDALDFAETIVNTLDVSLDEETEKKIGTMTKADVMVVPLRVAQADNLATLINELLTKAATGDTPMKDFIRRFRLLDEKGNPLADVNLDRPIAVFGEPDSNSLIIASTKENCMVVKQIAMAFDHPPSKAEIQSKVFTLDYADATEVAGQLNEMLTQSEQITSKPSGGGSPTGVPEGKSGILVYKAVVTADARTNQVVVIGRPEAVDVLGGLIEKLDVKGQGVMPFEIVKLEHASASALAQALSDLMDRRKEAIPAGGDNSQKSETVIIVPDERSVSLIIAAKRERIEELRDLIHKLDVPATALIENIRTITLRHSTATDLAQKLQDLWQQSEQNRSSGDSGLKFETPAIVADERSNSLIVAASESDFDAIKSVVDKIENLELNPMLDIYIVRLKYNSAAELASPLQSMFDQRAERSGLGEPRPEDKVKIESDPVTNALIFTASKENYELLIQKVADLDQEIGTVPVVEFFRCENVYASVVKDAIDNLYPDVFIPGQSSDNSVMQNRMKVSVVVDSRANMLIVSASPENMKVIRDVYEKMNNVREPWTPVDWKTIPLVNRSASEIAQQVQSSVEDLANATAQSGGQGNQQNAYAVKVIPDAVRNLLFIGGTRDGVRMAVDIVKHLDQPLSDETMQNPYLPVKVYKLSQAKAQAIGEILRNIFDARKQTESVEGTESTPVTIEINEPSNSLVVNATRQDQAIVKGLLDQLDQPSAIEKMFRVFPLSKAPADKVKEILDEVYQPTGGQGGGQSITTVAENRTNSIVVAAPQGELENIAQLVDRIDQVKIKELAQVEVIQCENEDASKMSELLNEIMTGQSAQGGASTAADAEAARSLSSLLISYEAKDQYGRRDVIQTVRENVQITYNERANSIIVVAPPSSMELIKRLVQKLDKIEKRSVKVKVFQLVNSDATIMVDKLESMFAQDQGSQDQQAFQEGREISVEGGVSDVGAGPEFASAGNERKGTFGRPKTTFVADERTNSVIVAGWPEDIDVAADIIDALDSRDIQERITTVYPLVNMKADEVQGALDSYFQAQRETLSSQEGIAQSRLIEQDVTVVAHQESNQLIVSSSPRYQSEVLRIIQQLDAPPPQVMIEVMIAEVTLDDNFEMGMEFALQQLHFSETATAGPNGVIHSNSFDFVGGTDLGAAGAGLGGFSFTITGEDFNFLIRALQTDSRLDVIQRPMIMCQNNQTATINIGQEVPFVRGSTTTSGGNTQANIEYEPVGVILNVEPIINPDGFVYMLIEPEVSSVTDSSVPIGNGIFAPIISNQSASTTVAVKDGETVVIGGLITTRATESESKVPLLGDIPGVGNLFRTTTRRNTRTELLIAMTPTIIRSVEDARRVSEFERDIGGIITPEVKSSPLMRNLQVQPETPSEIDSIETAPGAMKSRPLPTGKPQPITPNQGQDYIPQAPRYGPVVPKSTTGTANVMASGASATPRGATQAAYQPTTPSRSMGTMQPALPTVDQVRSGAVPPGRAIQDHRPIAPRPGLRPDDSRPIVASAPARTYMRLPEEGDAASTRPIVKISTHPSSHTPEEIEAIRRAQLEHERRQDSGTTRRAGRRDTHR